MATTFASPPQRILVEAPPPRQRSGPRYTVDGSDALEEYLYDSTQLVKEAVLSALLVGSVEGLLLGGGYGRGEGGVRAMADGERPYNDLEFYVFVRGNRHVFEHRFGETLHQLSHELAQRVGVEIEFKVLTFEQLRRAPISMFFYDMIAGHKWLVGSDDLLRGCEHHRAAHLLPLSEATRLLMNRCSGLLFAREHLGGDGTPFASEEADFVRRNIAKAQLAMGDAILAAFGRYHWSCRERHERLKQFSVRVPSRRELIEYHRRGVEFKLHPFCSNESHEQLTCDLKEITGFAHDLWLWLESQRLHHSFICVRHYAMSALPKWPETNPIRNLLLNLKLFRRPIVHNALRHPRERILESLALLLWDPVALTDSTLRDFLQANLRAPVRERSTAVSRYRQLWSLVS